MSRWFTIQIQANLLETARSNLARQGYAPFFPKLKKKRGALEPLFRGYGFVSFDPATQPFRPINGTRGVIGLLPRFTLAPQPMREGFVETLLKSDPVPEASLYEVFEELLPGLAVEIQQTDHILYGKSFRIVQTRNNLLQITLLRKENTLHDIWVDKSIVRPA